MFKSITKTFNNIKAIHRDLAEARKNLLEKEIRLKTTKERLSKLSTVDLFKAWDSLDDAKKVKSILGL